LVTRCSLFPMKSGTLKLAATSLHLPCNESLTNELIPLAPLFANQAFIHKSLGAFDLDCGDTLARLGESSIICPPMNEALLNTYLSHFKLNGFLDLPSSNCPSEKLVLQKI
jgi:hypothetical protein